MPFKCRQQCYSCNPAPLENKTSGCVPVRHYQRLTVSEHGRLSGREDMMAEIKARGPITCAINATSALDKCVACFNMYYTWATVNHLWQCLSSFC